MSQFLMDQTLFPPDKPHGQGNGFSFEAGDISRALVLNHGLSTSQRLPQASPDGIPDCQMKKSPHHPDMQSNWVNLLGLSPLAFGTQQ